MTHKARAIILCEDRAHYHFIRAFLVANGWEKRAISSRISPAGRGAGEQFVREKFPEELAHLRARTRQQLVLIVMIDGDGYSVEGRIQSLERQAETTRFPDERAAIFVPCRNLETWMAYLDDVDVDEEMNYPAYKKNNSRTKPARQLAAKCRERIPLVNAPASLLAACDEWRQHASIFR